MFECKGYCRFNGTKCRHLKIENAVGTCKKDRFKRILRDEKNARPKIISTEPNVNIKAPDWCPKIK